MRHIKAFFTRTFGWTFPLVPEFVRDIFWFVLLFCLLMGVLAIGLI